MRLFIGIPAPREFGTTLHGKIMPSLDRHGIFCVPQTQYHITLAFLGEREAQELPGLFERFDHVMHDHLVSSVHCKGVITFPSGAAPRTIVTPVIEGKEQMIRIAKELRTGLGVTGRMGKSIPHLTVARVRKGTSIDRGKLVRSLGPLIDIRFIPEEIVLFRSHLERSGARYERLRSIRLHK